ncbi:hypothetical protein K438DRAFT_407896 [Mycena galopus ATCC 62051]|nr:hypothetical protein K438DRAFT_407896 [Mycena galopus ATCC 62051]
MDSSSMNFAGGYHDSAAIRAQRNSAEGAPNQLILSSHHVTLPTSAQEAGRLLRWIRGYRNTCELEQSLALEKLKNTTTYLQMLREDIENARRRLENADDDVGKVRNAIRMKGFSMVTAEAYADDPGAA